MSKKGVVPILTPPAGATPASNTDAVWVLAADPQNGWAIKQVIFAYDTAPTAGTRLGIKIQWGTNTIVGYLTNGGVGPLIFDQARVFPLNTTVTITLPAAGVGISGTIMDVSAWLTMEGVGG